MNYGHKFIPGKVRMYVHKKNGQTQICRDVVIKVALLGRLESGGVKCGPIKGITFIVNENMTRIVNV